MSKNTKILSVEDEGFRKLCPKRFPKASNVKRAVELGGYETLEGDEFLFCKPLEQNMRFIHIAAILAKANFVDWEKILASLDFLYKANIPPEVPKVSLADAEVDKFCERFLEKGMPESLFALTNLLFWPDPKQLQNVLKKAVPKFFDKYPDGRLYFLRISAPLPRMQSVSRVLTAIDAFGFEVFEDTTIREQGAGRLLSKIHPQTMEPITETVIRTLLSCFFRHVYGTYIPRLGGGIVVQIDPPCDLELPYLRDRWDFNRLRGMFDSEIKLDFEQYLHREPLTADQERIGYKRYVFQPAWTAQQFEDLLKWTVEGINKFLRITINLCDYTNEAGYIDFIKQRKIVLTLERVIAEINYIVTEIDPFVRKTLYFNLHDKIATLPDPTVNMTKRRTIFNRLLKLTHYRSVLRKRMGSLPIPFNATVTSLGDALFQETIERSIESIWAQYRVSEKIVRTRRMADTINGYITQSMQDRPDPYMREDFAVNFLHEIRNSLHGYQLQGGGFEEFLLMHSGEVPDALPDLTVIWYFLLLADPQGLISGEWTKGVSPRDAVK